MLERAGFCGGILLLFLSVMRQVRDPDLGMRHALCEIGHTSACVVGPALAFSEQTGQACTPDIRWDRPLDPHQAQPLQVS